MSTFSIHVKKQYMNLTDMGADLQKIDQFIGEMEALGATISFEVAGVEYKSVPDDQLNKIINLTDKVCPCGIRFSPRRRDQVYCSAACRAKYSGKLSHLRREQEAEHLA